MPAQLRFRSAALFPAIRQHASAPPVHPLLAQRCANESIVKGGMRTG